MKNIIFIVIVMVGSLYAKTNNEILIENMKNKIYTDGVSSLNFDECRKTYLTYWNGVCLISKKYKNEKLKNRKEKLANANTYLGIKMYSFIDENKNFERVFDRYKAKFKRIGLDGEVYANDFEEIEKIQLSGFVSQQKLKQIKMKVKQKYKYIAQNHTKKIESAEDLNTKAYNLYTMGLINDAYYQAYAQNLTDKIVSILTTTFMNKDDKIV